VAQPALQRLLLLCGQNKPLPGASRRISVDILTVDHDARIMSLD